jgi:hypothetical protein
MLWRAVMTIALAALLAAADLAHKAAAATPEWGYHSRSDEWLALTAAVVLGCLLLARVPSWAVASAAGILAGGASGNALSAVGSGEGVPNPIVVGGSDVLIAFNLADVFTLAGILVLTSVLVVVTIDNRERLLPPRAVWRETRRRLGGERPQAEPALVLVRGDDDGQRLPRAGSGEAGAPGVRERHVYERPNAVQPCGRE